jgi:glucose/arabinose dehydrogenase
MAVTPAGNILVTEKGLSIDGGPKLPGTVRLIKGGELVEKPLADFAVKTVNESGMLGIELMPDFEQSREFVVTYTPKHDQKHLYLSRLRLLADGTAQVLEAPWYKLPSRSTATRHFGGNVRTTEEYIFVSMSDVNDNANPQDLSKLWGSILRFNLDMSVPETNPFGSNNPIFAYGLRNCFDLDFDGEGRLFCGENGHKRHDHVNYIQKGHNYGWPSMLGYCDHTPVLERCAGRDFTEPVFEFGHRIGPTGILAYTGGMFPEWRGHLFLGGWHSGEVHHLRPAGDGRTSFEVASEPFFVLPEGPFPLRDDAQRQHLNQYGVTDVAEAPDGSILVLESGQKRGNVYRIARNSDIDNREKVVDIGQRRLKEKTIGERACAQGNGAPVSVVVLLVFCSVVLLMRHLRPEHLRESSIWIAALGTFLSILIASWVLRAETDRLQYGGSVAVNTSRITGDNVYDAEFGIGTAAHGLIRLRMGKHFGLEGGLGYAHKGSGLKRTDEQLDLYYLSTPLTVFGRLQAGNVGLRLHAGISSNYLLHGEIADGQELTGELSRYEFAVLGGIGVDTPLWKQLRGTADLRYERGISVVRDPDDRPPYIRQVDRAWNNTIYLLVGLMFP